MRIISTSRVMRNRPSFGFVIAVSVGLGWNLPLLIFSIIDGEYFSVALTSASILVLLTLLILHVRKMGTRVTTVIITRAARFGEEGENGDAQTD